MSFCAVNRAGKLLRIFRPELLEQRKEVPKPAHGRCSSRIVFFGGVGGVLIGFALPYDIKPYKHGICTAGAENCEVVDSHGVRGALIGYNRLLQATIGYRLHGGAG